MKKKVLLIAAMLFLSFGPASAQKHEIAFTSGGLKIGERGFDLPQPGFLHFGTGFTYELNFAERLLDARLAALYVEVPFAGTPSTKVKTTNALSPSTYSSIFFTPGVKVRLLPRGKYSPFAALGAG